MIVEDFYSTQSRLRQEQAELLSLLKDDSCTWPSSSLDKETEGCSSSLSLRHQKMKADSKRPSRPPGSASCSSTSGSPNTSMSEDDEDGCEIVRHHRRRPRTSARSVTTKQPPTGAALEAEKSIYHSKIHQ